MGKLILAAVMALSFTGCNWLKSGSGAAALTSVESAGCDEQNSVLSAFSANIATAFNCSAPAAIQASLTAALGNVYLCKYVPAAAAPGSVATQGVVGNLVCPIAASAVVGFLTSAIPIAWGCTVSNQASAVVTALTSICETAVPYSSKGVTK